jgi:protein-disulfide isomerase
MKYKQNLVACAILMLFLSTSSALAAANVSGQSKVQLQVGKTWQLPAKPLDIVYSLDGKKVFILTKQNQVLVYKADGELLGKIDVEKGVSAIDIAPRGEKLFLINQNNNSFTDLSVDFIVNVDITGSPYIGPDDAPVTIAVFTDFECVHCGKAAPLLEQVHEKNPDTVKIVFKNMPLNFNKFAVPAALAALAAGEQGKFWEFHDELFAISPKLSPKDINGIATKLGLDIAKFTKDMTSPSIKQKLTKDIEDAQDAGVTGTPTIFVNGSKVKNRSLSAIQELIDKELSKNSLIRKLPKRPNNNGQ